MSAWSCDPATPSVGSAAPDRFSGETVHPSLLEAGHRRPLRHRVAETGPLTPTGGASAPAVTGTGRPRCCDPSPTPTPFAARGCAPPRGRWCSPPLQGSGLGNNPSDPHRHSSSVWGSLGGSEFPNPLLLLSSLLAGSVFLGGVFSHIPAAYP